MATKPRAGGLRQKLHFQRRAIVDDGFGNEISGPFETVFTDVAEFIPLRGGEGVQAARLTGVSPYIVRVRSSTNTRSVTAAWQMVDARSGRVFAITAPPTDPDQKNAWLDIMATDGVAS